MTEHKTELDNLLQDQPQPARRGLNLGSIVLLIGVIMALGTIGWAYIVRGNEQPTSGPAPDFTITTFEGEAFSLSDQRGKIVVINFWGSWCAPCRDEAPHLQAVYEKYQDEGVVLVGVTYLDTREDSLAFIEEFGLTYPNGPDSRVEISRNKYRIRGAPENFVVDRDGNITYFHLGPITESQLSAVLDDLLAEDRAS
jgi:cytochrome c biogenesis protein CcmG, thiol:disulfide interchange protein DsbE